MAQHCRSIPLPNFLTRQSSFDDNGIAARYREPLSDSAGNAQFQGFGEDIQCHDTKRHHDAKDLSHRMENSRLSISTIPLQPLKLPLRSTLELRRASLRKRRHLRFSRNPIADSPQYQQYRERQCRDGDPKDKKWPDLLESAFLDALIDMPVMGRRKYSFHGKPHGRNEMITEYLWIAYLQSLPEGVRPDPTMKRERKQVSSHIQVLKGFFKGHPAFDRLFPKDTGPKNGFEDSFKNDPCLLAISAGRLPSRRSDQFQEVQQLFLCNMRPVVFWLLLDSSGLPTKDIQEEDLYRKGRVTHKFTGLSLPNGQRRSLDSIPHWRRKFPYLSQLCADGPLNCDLVHMDVSLNLLTSAAPEGSTLLSKTILSMQGKQPGDWEWRIITTLTKPTELYRDLGSDPPINGEICPVVVTSSSDSETQIKITYPANSWANSFACLRNIQSVYEEQLKRQRLTNLPPAARPAREYVEQISMFYEVQSRMSHELPWITKSILLWTFHEAREGELNDTIWRNLSVEVDSPPRNMIMSPSPHSNHRVSAAMSENFNHWTETPMRLSHSNLLESFVQNIQAPTPPHTAGLQSPFVSQPEYDYHPHDYSWAGNSLDLLTSTTLDSESAPVDSSDSNITIDRFISTNTVHLDEYEHAGVSSDWHIPASQSFDTSSTWAGLHDPPVQMWDPQDNQDSQKPAWSGMSSERSMTWVDHKHEWVESHGDESSMKPSSHNPGDLAAAITDGSTEQRSLPWHDEHAADHHEHTIKLSGFEDMATREDAVEHTDLTMEASNAGHMLTTTDADVLDVEGHHGINLDAALPLKEDDWVEHHDTRFDYHQCPDAE